MSSRRNLKKWQSIRRRTESLLPCFSFVVVFAAKQWCYYSRHDSFLTLLSAKNVVSDTVWLQGNFFFFSDPSWVYLWHFLKWLNRCRNNTESDIRETRDQRLNLHVQLYLQFDLWLEVSLRKGLRVSLIFPAHVLLFDIKGYRLAFPDTFYSGILFCPNILLYFFDSLSLSMMSSSRRCLYTRSRSGSTRQFMFASFLRALFFSGRFSWETRDMDSRFCMSTFRVLRDLKELFESDVTVTSGFCWSLNWCSSLAIYCCGAFIVASVLSKTVVNIISDFIVSWSPPFTFFALFDVVIQIVTQG